MAIKIFAIIFTSYYYLPLNFQKFHNITYQFLLRANMKWYNISKKSQKLILLMTMRSQTPCKLTAGKIMELSIENFGMVKNT